MELASDEPGVVLKFDCFHEGPIRAGARDNQAGFFQGGDKRVVDFVTVTKPKSRRGRTSAEPRDDTIRRECDVESAKSHVAAESFDFLLFG